MERIRQPHASADRIAPAAGAIEDADTGARPGRGRKPRHRALCAQPVVPARNPFEIFGGPYAPMRVMFAPLEVALYLPAYAVDLFHGHRSPPGR